VPELLAAGDLFVHLDFMPRLGRHGVDRAFQFQLLRKQRTPLREIVGVILSPRTIWRCGVV